MGGLVIARFVTDPAHPVSSEVRERICGTFLSAPALSVFVPGFVNKMLAPFAKPVNRIPGARSIVKANDIAASTLTRDAQEQKNYEDDELV